MRFGEYIKQMRDIQNISQNKFCKLYGICQGTWSKIEKGIYKPPAYRHQIKKIACILLLSKAEYEQLRVLAAVEFIPPGLIEDELKIEIVKLKNKNHES